MNFHLIRDMLRTSVTHRLVQCLRGQFIFLLLMVSLIRVPLKVTRNIIPNYFPLSIYPSDPIIESILDIMMLNLFLLVAERSPSSMPSSGPPLLDSQSVLCISVNMHSVLLTYVGLLINLSPCDCRVMSAPALLCGTIVALDGSYP